jgi:hypothetical protein
MKNLFLIVTVLSLFALNYSFGQKADEEAIKKVITEAYIEGIQNNGNIESIRNGFHPTFTMLRLMENDIKPLPIGEWIAAIEKRKSEGSVSSVRTEGKFIAVDITGNAAIVKLELYREGKKTFTDYLVLYKFAEGWKIVSKTYFRH